MASLLLLSANLRPYNRIRYLFFPLSLPYFICESVDFTLKCLELSEKNTNFAAELSVYASLGRSHKDETTINIIITNKTKTLMKKIFTLISMALVAMSVNAQDTWVPDVDYVAAPSGTMATEFSNPSGSGYDKIAVIDKSPINEAA